jgi:predicted Zn-dependent protease
MAESEATAPIDAEAATAEAEPVPADAGGPPGGDQALEEEPADEEPAPEPGTFDKAPPRGLLIGVAAGLTLLLLLGGGLVIYRKLALRGPPPAAMDTLTSAQADADKDTLASIAAAETKAKDALDVAGPRARFPEATAALARIQIQLADALTDQAGRIADRNADDPRVAQLQSDAKAKVKSAFEQLSRASKGNEASPDLQLAFADYYRAKRLPSSMNRYLKEVRDEPRKALVEGLALLQEDDGATGAIPKLKTALAANPQSARIHYRLATAHLASRDEASARSELKETLRLSPQHERALQALEQLGPGAGERK